MIFFYFYILIPSSDWLIRRYITIKKSDIISSRNNLLTIIKLGRIECFLYSMHALYFILIKLHNILPMKKRNIVPISKRKYYYA